MKFETLNGQINISNDVFSNVAGAAAINCFGVKGMAVRSKTEFPLMTSPQISLVIYLFANEVFHLKVRKIASA